MDIEQLPTVALVDTLKSEKTYLCGIGLAPMLAVGIGLFVLRSSWAAIVLLHLSMVVLPLLYARSHSLSLLDLLNRETERLTVQLQVGLALLSFSIISTLISLLALSSLPGTDVVSMLGFARVSCDYFLFPCGDVEPIIAFAVYFSVVNPAIEEAFWRLFLYKNLPRTEGGKWAVSVLYATYHVVVVLCFSGPWQAVLCAVSLTIMGRLFVLVKENTGLVAATMLHSGLDVGVMAVWLYLLFSQ